MASPKFEVVEDDTPAGGGQAASGQASANLLFVALKVLSQRTLVAIDNLFCLLTVSSAWWLWYSIPDPSQTQITSLGLYAAFVLAANWLVRRK